jgi:HIRAN domain.
MSSDARNALPFESDGCPPCGAQVATLPKGTKRCRTCGEQMYVVVIDGMTRRLVAAPERDAVGTANVERVTAEHKAAELGWYTSLRASGLRLSDDPDEGETLSVVGESHYLETLAGLMAALRVDPRDREVTTVGRLTREPANRYDRNAVRVDVHGQHVGYLSREDAVDIQGWLRTVERDGPVFVLARLGGGLVQDGQVGPIGVTIEQLPPVFG